MAHVGYGVAGKRGYWIEPTVFSHVRDDMTIAREEIFGPVQSILKWSTVEEVIARANDSHYGLAAGVWTRDIDLANTISRALKAGTVWINTWYGIPITWAWSSWSLSRRG